MGVCNICGKKTMIFNGVSIANGHICTGCRADAGIGTSFSDCQLLVMLSVEQVRQRINVRKYRDIAISKYDYECEKLGGTNFVYESENRLWFADNAIYVAKGLNEYILNYANDSEFKYEKIPAEQLQMFYKEGDVQYTTKISGGGGGGSSVLGALVGGAIAGEVGAIIGSRKSTNNIVSNTVAHDRRKTVVRYFDANNELRVFEWTGFDLYNYLLKYVPQKDLVNIQINDLVKQDTKPNEEKNTYVSAADEIRKYKQLYDEGIITEGEFIRKKEQLLQ